MKPKVSLQYCTAAILAIATFWADRAGLELCPKHTLEKLAQDSKMISSLSAERDRLEDKLKGAAIREKRLSEHRERLVRDLTRFREVLRYQEIVSFSLGFLGILTFFIGVWVGGRL